MGRFEYLVADSNGRILIRGKRVGGRADTIDSVSGAATANRVAFQFGHLGKGQEETVVILDVDTKKEILHFKVSLDSERATVGKFTGEEFVSPQIALSPSGTKLAILTGNLVSLFNVP